MNQDIDLGQLAALNLRCGDPDDLKGTVFGLLQIFDQGQGARADTGSIKDGHTDGLLLSQKAERHDEQKQNGEVGIGAHRSHRRSIWHHRGSGEGRGWFV
ncbi:hypothetical protein [Prosthecobacter sp.]|uniref:hypothetical protein n=1 Tax=Prosthecobacter sp. TaxID=1965333 RepID=UPI003904DC2B